MCIAKNLLSISQSLPVGVSLIAISKTKPVEAILEAYDAGQRAFGENRPQELMQKQSILPADIEWHFIGHLQTNKVKYIAPFVHLIHGIDSLKLLSAINKEAQKNHRIIKCLIQFHIAAEETKFGFNLPEAIEMLTSEEFKSLQNVSICGVMGMATYTNDVNRIRSEFKELSAIFSRLKTQYFNAEPAFCEISMGMSGDYKIAIDEGSTLVRIGSKIFGSR